MSGTVEDWEKQKSGCGADQCLKYVGRTTACLLAKEEKKLPDCASPVPSCFLSLLSRERLAAARRLGIRRASYLTLHGQSTRSAQPSPRGFPGDLIVGPRLVEAPPLAHGCVPFPRSADLLMEVRLPLETRRWKKDRSGLRCQDDGRSAVPVLLLRDLIRIAPRDLDFD